MYETCKCKCRLDASFCNSEQRRNEGKCRCECRELINKGSCDKGFIWNPSNVNVLNHGMLENIQTIQIVSAEGNQLMNQLKNALKILMK